MTASKSQREDEVIHAFVVYVCAAGRTVALVENPDRLLPAARTYADVTSDALLSSVDANGIASEWAVDVMAAAADFADFQIPDQLHLQLDTVAKARGLDVRVVGKFADVQEANIVVRDCKQAISASSGIPASFSALDGKVQVSFAATRSGGNVDFVVSRTLQAPEGVSPAQLSWQLESTLSRPLTKKVEQQAAPARLAGCKTAVLIDAVGHDGIQQGTHWLPRCPGTYAQAVTAILSRTSASVDYVGLLMRDGSWHDLYGDGP